MADNAVTQDSSTATSNDHSLTELRDRFPGRLAKNEQQAFSNILKDSGSETRETMKALYHYNARVLDLKTRHICTQCWFLESHCICPKYASLDIKLKHDIVLYMHYKEFTRSSNTGVSILRAAPKCSSLLIFHVPDDEKKMEELLKKPNVFLLSPSPDSTTFEEFTNKIRQRENLSPDDPLPRCTAIALDGTWTQAKHLVRRFPKEIPRVRLSNATFSVSNMRKQSQKGRISTAEAITLLLSEMSEPQEVLNQLWESIKIRVETYHWQQGKRGFSLHDDDDDGDEEGEEKEKEKEKEKVKEKVEDGEVDLKKRKTPFVMRKGKKEGGEEEVKKEEEKGPETKTQERRRRRKEKKNREKQAQQTSAPTPETPTTTAAHTNNLPSSTSVGSVNETQ